MLVKLRQGSDDFWLIIDEDELIKMIRLAFDVPWFKIDHLIDVFDAEEDDTNEHNRIKKERLALLEMTMLLDEHPKEYDGPCLCESCCSYD
jgi:hypothetical protein